MKGVIFLTIIKGGHTVATLPKTVGTCADKLYTLNQEMGKLRKKHETEMAKYKKEFMALQEHALGLLNSQKSSGAKGKVGQLTKKFKAIPVIENFDEVWKYAKKEDASDLFGRSLNATAVRQRWDANIAIPGVGTFSKISLSITKAK